MTSMNFDYEPLYPTPGTCALPAIGGKIQGEPSEDPIKEESAKEPTKCRYKPAVLVGDWFERRAKYVPPPDNWVTVYDSTYNCKWNPDYKKDRRAFESIKHKAERGLGAEFLIEHPGEAFRRNFTTTNDLHYRIIPQGLCGPKVRKYSSRKDMWLPEEDLTKSHGNLTEWGLAEVLGCRLYMATALSPRESIQKSAFRKRDLSEVRSEKRFPRPIGKMNEPMLCHLDIDPDQPFRPHLIKIKTNSKS